MRRGIFYAALAAAFAVEAMPLGLRTAAWGIAPANRRAAVDEVFPDMGESATAAEIAAVLGGAADWRIAANITDTANYAEFREWAKYAGAPAVKGSVTAWMSFAVGADGLIAPPEDGGLAIDDFAVGSDGSLVAVFSLDGVDVGSSTPENRLKSVFAVEGAATLLPGEFSPDGVAVSLAPTGDGRVKATVTPPVNAGNAYFLKVRLK